MAPWDLARHGPFNTAHQLCCHDCNPLEGMVSLRLSGQTWISLMMHACMPPPNLCAHYFSQFLLENHHFRRLIWSVMERTRKNICHTLTPSSYPTFQSRKRCFEINVLPLIFGTSIKPRIFYRNWKNFAYVPIFASWNLLSTIDTPTISDRHGSTSVCWSVYLSTNSNKKNMSFKRHTYLKWS